MIGGGLRPILGFAARFLLAALLLVPLWWLAAPTYGWLLVQVCGSSLRALFSMPISAGNIEVAGILNTESLLTLYIGEQSTSMKFVKLITNLPPFIALIVATPGFSLGRRLLAVFLGSTILCCGHIVFIVLALRFGHAFQETPEIPTAVAQFFLTLPFLLWVAIAYGHGLFSATESGQCVD